MLLLALTSLIERKERWLPARSQLVQHNDWTQLAVWAPDCQGVTVLYRCLHSIP